jgi:hypothetical protein
VVDDGSTDDLASALRPCGDAVQVLRKPGGGVSSARNTAAHRNGAQRLHPPSRGSRRVSNGRSAAPPVLAERGLYRGHLRDPQIAGRQDVAQQKAAGRTGCDRFERDRACWTSPRKTSAFWVQRRAA